MFNDLNNPNNQNRQAVDDIFAETDKTQENAASASAASRPAGGAEIDTQRIGLAATDELSESAPEKRSQDKLFKIIIAVIAVAVLGLGGYLIYSKFFNAPADITPIATTTKQTDVPQTTVPTTNTAGSFVETAGTTPATTTQSVTTPIIPGVNTPATTTETVTATPALVDSDSDGLTDAEEKIAGTNINIIDTDNDGLSDYEEVKIYKINPLSADTDGDSYLDGAEVKSGYNPNGTGKLSDAVSAVKTVPTTK
ncbi:MAG: hypothetical protein WC719_02840 [Patescibacteria group bacterium]|jgi:hypothetical protein